MESLTIFRVEIDKFKACLIAPKVDLKELEVVYGKIQMMIPSKLIKLLKLPIDLEKRARVLRDEFIFLEGHKSYEPPKDNYFLIIPWRY